MSDSEWRVGLHEFLAEQGCTCPEIGISLVFTGDSYPRLEITHSPECEVAHALLASMN